jgi:hypothetical protein
MIAFPWAKKRGLYSMSGWEIITVNNKERGKKVKRKNGSFLCKIKKKSIYLLQEEKQWARAGV